MKRTNADSEAFVKKLKRAAREVSDDGDPCVRRQDVAHVLVGSDCSGYGSDALALQLLALQPNIAFVVEKDEGKRAIMTVVHTVGGRTLI